MKSYIIHTFYSHVFSSTLTDSIPGMIFQLPYPVKGRKLKNQPSPSGIKGEKG